MRQSMKLEKDVNPKPRKVWSGSKARKRGHLNSHVKLFEETSWTNDEQSEKSQLKLFSCTLKGHEFDSYTRFES